LSRENFKLADLVEIVDLVETCHVLAKNTDVGNLITGSVALLARDTRRRELLAELGL